MCLINKGCESMYFDYIGDGFCDDGNNNADCEYDGGDCCGLDINTDYCDECNCFELGGNHSSYGTTFPSTITIDGNHFILMKNFSITRTPAIFQVNN